MSLVRKLVFEKTVKAGVFVARGICRGGDCQARVVAHVVNGRGIYGFDEESPDPIIEEALARRTDRQIARLVNNALELGA